MFGLIVVPCRLRNIIIHSKIKTLFEKQFPADVVIEGIDQTRGWFYSLLAVSTLFTGKAPYKRVLSLGHVLDENGQKMSKSKGNALDPVELIQKLWC